MHLLCAIDPVLKPVISHCAGPSISVVSRLLFRFLSMNDLLQAEPLLSGIMGETAQGRDPPVSGVQAGAGPTGRRRWA